MIFLYDLLNTQSLGDQTGIGVPSARLMIQPATIRIATPTMIMASWAGVLSSPRLTMSTVAPAGGCEARNKSSAAPRSARESAAAPARASVTPSCTRRRVPHNAPVKRQAVAAEHETKQSIYPQADLSQCPSSTVAKRPIALTTVQRPNSAIHPTTSIMASLYLPHAQDGSFPVSVSPGRCRPLAPFQSCPG